MWKQIAEIAKTKSVVITVSNAGEGKLVVSVVPKTTQVQLDPITMVGTPEEIEVGMVKALEAIAYEIPSIVKMDAFKESVKPKTDVKSKEKDEVDLFKTDRENHDKVDEIKKKPKEPVVENKKEEVIVDTKTEEKVPENLSNDSDDDKATAIQEEYDTTEEVLDQIEQEEFEDEYDANEAGEYPEPEDLEEDYQNGESVVNVEKEKKEIDLEF